MIVIVIRKEGDDERKLYESTPSHPPVCTNIKVQFKSN